MVDIIPDNKRRVRRAFEHLFGIFRNPTCGHRPDGFLNDGPEKAGTKPHPHERKHQATHTDPASAHGGQFIVAGKLGHGVERGQQQGNGKYHDNEGIMPIHFKQEEAIVDENIRDRCLGVQEVGESIEQIKDHIQQTERHGAIPEGNQVLL